MFQNRVDPLGNIICTSARGTWMGNRGQLHGKGKIILRSFKHRAWIICLLEFKCRDRPIMSPDLWTELFFFDEVTAFAAGHRPCFECRRDAADLSKAAWLKGNAGYGFSKKTSIQAIDKVLPHERIDTTGRKVTYEAAIKNLPDGTFIQIASEPYLVMKELIFHWTPFGYEKGITDPTLKKVNVLTPQSIVNAFCSGYIPQIGVYLYN